MSDIGTLIDYPMPVINTFSEACIGPHTVGTGIGGATSAAAWGSSNVALYFPVRIGYPIIVQKMFWFNGTTVGTNSVDIGIYDNQSNQLYHSGSTLTSGASVLQSVTLGSPLTLEPGIYYMAMVVNGTTDTFFSLATAGAPDLLPAGVYQQASAFPLPSPATLAIGVTNSKYPIMGFTTNSSIL